MITNYFINWFRTKESKNQTLNFKIFNEQEVDDTDKILEGWKDYFSELKTGVSKITKRDT